MKNVIPFLSGLLFGLGLLVSGMNDPQKVRAFLDVFGSWQPELIAVMGAAVVTFFIVFQLSKSRNKPLFAPGFHLPSLQEIDLRLITGAVMFGIGWGMVGLCPGPALVDILSGNESVLIFVAALIAGNRLAHYLVGPAKSR
ncbi:MAG: hypothetical protein CSH37_14965 [Thalassolituus sp.]|nr:MAG: hypothetical protein CSH37_14965 [Thalassolituus sp.]